MPFGKLLFFPLLNAFDVTGNFSGPTTQDITYHLRVVR